MFDCSWWLSLGDRVGFGLVTGLRGGFGLGLMLCSSLIDRGMLGAPLIFRHGLGFALVIPWQGIGQAKLEEQWSK